MSYEPNRNKWEYPYPRNIKTERIIQRMITQDHMPCVHFYDEFINIDIETLSKYKTEYIDEWYRTSQILLFESFQQNISQWMEISKQKKEEAKILKERRKIEHYKEKRNKEINRSHLLDTDKLSLMPDDIIHLIWSYTDIETQIKYYIGKYSPEECYDLLNRLTCPILRKIYKNTTFCYKGYAMKRELYPWHKKAQPCSNFSKTELILHILPFLNNMNECYEDEKVITTKTDKGMKIRSFRSNEQHTDEEIDVLYPFYGTIYPIPMYEENAKKLWKSILVAYHIKSQLSSPISHHIV